MINFKKIGTCSKILYLIISALLHKVKLANYLWMTKFYPSKHFNKLKQSIKIKLPLLFFIHIVQIPNIKVSKTFSLKAIHAVDVGIGGILMFIILISNFNWSLLKNRESCTFLFFFLNLLIHYSNFFVTKIVIKSSIAFWVYKQFLFNKKILMRRNGFLLYLRWILWLNFNFSLSSHFLSRSKTKLSNFFIKILNSFKIFLLIPFILYVDNKTFYF